jgi:hypothetical protein
MGQGPLQLNFRCHNTSTAHLVPVAESNTSGVEIHSMLAWAQMTVNAHFTRMGRPARAAMPFERAQTGSMTAIVPQ